MIVNTGMEWIFGMLGGSPAPSGYPQGYPSIQYIAVGGSPNVVMPDQTKLTHERARVLVSQLYQATGVVVAEATFDYDQANFIWQEVGLFAGGNASADTGIMIARGLVSEDKDDRRTALIIYQLGLTRG